MLLKLAPGARELAASVFLFSERTALESQCGVADRKVFARLKLDACVLLE